MHRNAFFCIYAFFVPQVPRTCDSTCCPVRRLGAAIVLLALCLVGRRGAVVEQPLLCTCTDALPHAPTPTLLFGCMRNNQKPLGIHEQAVDGVVALFVSREIFFNVVVYVATCTSCFISGLPSQTQNPVISGRVAHSIGRHFPLPPLPWSPPCQCFWTYPIHVPSLCLYHLYPCFHSLFFVGVLPPSDLVVCCAA